MTNFRFLIVIWLGVVLAACVWPRIGHAEEPCRVVQQEKRVELCSPFFVFHLDTGAGLRAVAWENRLTGRKLSLGGGPELEFDIGLPEKPLQTPQLEVSKVEVKRQGETAEIVFQLAAKEAAASAVVTYRWDAKQPVLHKFVTIHNDAAQAWNRLLNVRLGRYDAGNVEVVDKPAGGRYSVGAPRAFPAARRSQVERGFPVYAADEFFFTLAHPAGVAEGSGGKVLLRQYPGMRVEPGKAFPCMEAVYGVAQSGAARQAFVAHVQSRMRRTVRGHDKPYAIFEPFGARPGGDYNETEPFLLDNLAKLAAFQRQTGCRFDYYSIDFWVDFHGDLKRCDPGRFPNGLAKILGELKRLGIAPGLWISSSMSHWSIGGNPAVRPTFTHDPKGPVPAVPIMCRATEPIRSMYTEAFRYHIREHGVRLLKFDDLHSICHNPSHEHLPGIYSTEAIHSAVIEFLHALDAECPEVFLMLYWGHRSPWWLLHADTLFDSGIGIEAASPSDRPAPYARDSITQKLDQAQWRANENVPALGKDSLGVWLSDWPWNSQVGKERWEEGFVMDLCRGSLLAQPWSDTPWLSPPERKQMAEFIALLKARPECFRHSRFILGDPWKDEPYGYCCTDGKRAFLALYNCCWKDGTFRLELNSAWGLPDGQTWDLYRWYPDPAKLVGKEASFGKTASIALRPFATVLLEVVPHGHAPTLNRHFDYQPMPTLFAEPSRSLNLVVEENCTDEKRHAEAIWTVLDPVRFTSYAGAILRKLPDHSILASGQNSSPDIYSVTVQTKLTGITGFRLEALPDPSLPSLGPGRAPNGNFVLSEFRVIALPPSGQGEAVPVKMRNPTADFSQDGWPVTAALDGDPKTGWSIDPLEGRPHTAVFETENQVGFPSGTTLEFILQQGTPRDHTLGRLRLSATTVKRPLPSPKPSGLRSLVVKGQVPASANGGILVVTVEMTRGSQPMRVGDPGKRLTAQGTLAGQMVPWKPVLGTATYPSCWQAWRVAAEPSSQPQPFELAITANLGPDVRLSSKAYFVAR